MSAPRACTSNAVQAACTDGVAVAAAWTEAVIVIIGVTFIIPCYPPVRAVVARKHVTTLSVSLVDSVFGLFLVAAQLNPAQAYSCLSDAHCQYEGCNDEGCEYVTKSSDYCNRDASGTFVWDATCVNGVCEKDLTSCPNPVSFCVPGTYSLDGYDGGVYLCSGLPCAAGKYGPSGGKSAAEAMCTDCETGKYSPSKGVISLMIMINVPNHCHITCMNGC